MQATHSIEVKATLVKLLESIESSYSIQKANKAKEILKTIGYTVQSIKKVDVIESLNNAIGKLDPLPQNHLTKYSDAIKGIKLNNPDKKETVESAITYPIPTGYKAGVNYQIYQINDNEYQCLDSDLKPVNGLSAFPKALYEMQASVPGMLTKWDEYLEQSKPIIKTVVKTVIGNIADPYLCPVTNQIIEFKDRLVEYLIPTEVWGDDGESVDYGYTIETCKACELGSKSYKSDLNSRFKFCPNKADILANAYTMGALTYDQYCELMGIKTPKLINTATNGKGKGKNDNATKGQGSGKPNKNRNYKEAKVIYNRYLSALNTAITKYGLKDLMLKMVESGITDQELKDWQVKAGKLYGQEYDPKFYPSVSEYIKLLPDTIKSVTAHLNCMYIIGDRVGYSKEGNLANAIYRLKSVTLPSPVEFTEQYFLDNHAIVTVLPSMAK